MGRENSSEVAQQLSTLFPIVNNPMIAAATTVPGVLPGILGTTSPGTIYYNKLNFFIYGDLSIFINHIPYPCNNIALAQAGVVGSNNWWIISNQPIGSQVFTSTQQAYQYACLQCGDKMIELRGMGSDTFGMIANAPDCPNDNLFSKKAK